MNICNLRYYVVASGRARHCKREYPHGGPHARVRLMRIETHVGSRRGLFAAIHGEPPMATTKTYELYDLGPAR
jgi:hypothetical protein